MSRKSPQEKATSANHPMTTPLRVHPVGMSRALSMATWGAALLAGAVVLGWRQSIPWAIATVGVIAVIAGLYWQGVTDGVEEPAQPKPH